MRFLCGGAESTVDTDVSVPLTDVADDTVSSVASPFSDPREVSVDTGVWVPFVDAAEASADVSAVGWVPGAGVDSVGVGVSLPFRDTRKGSADVSALGWLPGALEDSVAVAPVPFCVAVEVSAAASVAGPLLDAGANSICVAVSVSFCVAGDVFVGATVVAYDDDGEGCGDDCVSVRLFGRGTSGIDVAVSVDLSGGPAVGTSDVEFSLLPWPLSGALLMLKKRRRPVYAATNTTAKATVDIAANLSEAFQSFFCAAAPSASSRPSPFPSRDSCIRGMATRPSSPPSSEWFPSGGVHTFGSSSESESDLGVLPACLCAAYLRKHIRKTLASRHNVTAITVAATRIFGAVPVLVNCGRSRVPTIRLGDDRWLLRCRTVLSRVEDVSRKSSLQECSLTPLSAPGPTGGSALSSPLVYCLPGPPGNSSTIGSDATASPSDRKTRFPAAATAAIFRKQLTCIFSVRKLCSSSRRD